MPLTSEQIVKQKFCMARIWKPLTEWRDIEVHADGFTHPLPHLLGSGKTEQEAWDDAAYNVLNPWDLQKELDKLVSHLCGPPKN